jgi:hypothetical protein
MITYQKRCTRFTFLGRHLPNSQQYHTFARGGYYASEVIPNKLVVVALNTLFWFDSNKVRRRFRSLDLILRSIRMHS